MKILFQGDSITDAGRSREDPHELGHGYPKYAAEYIRYRHPGTDFEFINLGISGNQTKDLRARWQADCIDLQPDVVSILIGVNDTWHHAGDRSWLTAEYYEENYRSILTDIREKTNAKILMLEQFLLPSTDKGFFREDLDPKIQITRKLAWEFADVFVPLDGLLNADLVGEIPMAWSDDGVHPNAAGSRQVGRYYADAFDRIFYALKMNQ